MQIPKEYFQLSGSVLKEAQSPSLLELPVEIIYKIFLQAENLNALLKIRKKRKYSRQSKDILVKDLSLKPKELKEIFKGYKDEPFIKRYICLFAKYASIKPYAAVSKSVKFKKFFPSKFLSEIPLEKFSADVMNKIVISQDIKALNLLIENPTLDLAQDYSWAFKQACKCGNLSLVQKMMADLLIDPRQGLGDPFYTACYYGHFDLVIFFLERFEIDFSRNDSYALFQACHGCNLNLVELILKDANVNPAACKNRALIAAIIMGSEAIVERLLKDQRVDPSMNDNEAIIKACCGKDKPKIVKLLLKDKRVNPKARSNTSLWRAKQLENQETVAILEEYFKNPSAYRKSLSETRVIPKG